MEMFTKDAWNSASQETKNELMYGVLVDVNNHITRLDKFKWIKAGTNGLMSFVGGFAAVFIWIRFIKL